MSESWLWLDTGIGDAFWNMALDEALLRTASDRGAVLVRFYGWTQPSVSIGYFQKYPQHLADRHTVTRRPTGGGLVYHGDDTTYTVVAPPGHALHRMPTSQAYCLLHKAVATAMSPVEPSQTGNLMLVGGNRALDVDEAKAVTGTRAYECFVNPVPGDVVESGRKVAGAAQRRSRDGMLHQGSIAARVDGDRIKDGFGRVLGVTFRQVEATNEEQAMARQLVEQKYSRNEWLHRVT